MFVLTFLLRVKPNDIALFIPDGKISFNFSLVE